MIYLYFSLISLITLTASAQDNWPQFRGPDALGTTEQKGLPASWSTTENIAWSTPIPGRGWSSPVVWGERIFLTSVISSKDPGSPRTGLYSGGPQSIPEGEHRWVVMAVDWNTGKILWEREVQDGLPNKARHLKNSYASETPVLDKNHIYAHFGNLGVFAFNHQGEIAWSTRLKQATTRNGWGTGSSPVLHNDTLYVVNDNEEDSYIIAFDTSKGKELWRIDRDEKSNWSTPFIWENSLRTEIITTGSKKIRSYTLDGEMLWSLSGMSTITIPTPFSKHGLLYISSGYHRDSLRPVYAIRPGAYGDITLDKGTTKNDFIAWHQPQAGSYNPSPLAYGENYYTLYDMGFLTNHNAKTGEEIYDKRRIDPVAGNFTASPWAYDDKIFCLSEDGVTYVIQAGSEFKVIGQNSLDEVTLSTPAILRDSLIIRTASKLYRIRSNVERSDE